MSTKLTWFILTWFPSSLCLGKRYLSTENVDQRQNFGVGIWFFWSNSTSSWLSKLSERRELESSSDLVEGGVFKGCANCSSSYKKKGDTVYEIKVKIKTLSLIFIKICTFMVSIVFKHLPYNLPHKNFYIGYCFQWICPVLPRDVTSLTKLTLCSSSFIL